MAVYANKKAIAKSRFGKKIKSLPTKVGTKPKMLLGGRKPSSMAGKAKRR